MNYKIELTSKFKDKGQDRFFYLEKLNGSDWLPNEDLVNMITSIKLSECEEFFKSVISNEDFIFLEYSQIVLSDEGLLECQANNNNMVFSLFDDFYELPKPCFTQLVVDLINKLIENYDIIREVYNVNLMDINSLKRTKETLLPRIGSNS